MYIQQLKLDNKQKHDTRFVNLTKSCEPCISLLIDDRLMLRFFVDYWKCMVTVPLAVPVDRSMKFNMTKF